MAETQDNGTEQTQEIMTAADLRLEELSKRLDSLEAENRELREANKGLWAAAHNVDPEPAAQQDPPARMEPTVSDVDVLFKKLGVN